MKENEGDANAIYIEYLVHQLPMKKYLYETSLPYSLRNICL